MRVLVLSSVFPNANDPLFGVFVKERIKRVVPHCEVLVVAPVAWFPFNRWLRGTKRSEVPKSEIQDGLSVYHPKFFSVPGLCKTLDGLFYYLSVVVPVWRLHKAFHFDLIDAHFIFPDGLAACLLAKTFGCPVTITLRGTIGKLAKYQLRRRQIQWALKAASGIFCVSESLRDIAMGLGCDAQKMHVIPNGVDVNVFHPRNRMDARRRLGLPPDRTILLSVGTLSERKGHHRILQSLPRVVKKHRALLYVIVGGAGVEGDTGPLLRRQTADLALESHVWLVGSRPHYEISLWLAAADLFCLATSNEGMANVLVEALACGVPVVTTRVGGNAELINNGTNGYLISLGDSLAFTDALLDALQKQWDRESIAKKIMGRTWENVATQIVKEWTKAIEAVSCKDGPPSRSELV